MEESPKEKMTLRQAIAGQWQIPLFAIALASFVVVLWHLSPVGSEVPYETKLNALKRLAEQNEYPPFYEQAELLRVEAEDETQLAQLHGLVGQVRVRQLRQMHKLSLDEDITRASRETYELVISDYEQAVNRQWPYAETPAGKVEMYRDLGQVFWCMDDSPKAIHCYQQAIESCEAYRVDLHRDLVNMYQLSRPEGYLDEIEGHLNELLENPASGPDDKAWAFVRKAELLIAREQESQALSLLETADEAYLKSSYGEELEFLRARALRKSGETDRAEQMLRDLFDRTADRGDIYAQIALELGAINYEQYRDYDARYFYEKVVNSQAGKEWFVAGKLGLAECAALRQQYPESLELYQEVENLLNRNPRNRAVDFRRVQQSLGIMAEHLSLFKQYELALDFLEIEQQVASDDDIRSAYNYARTNAYRASQLLQQIKTLPQGASDDLAVPQSSLDEQRQLIMRLFELAAEHYLRVVNLAVHDDGLYGDCLWQAATCYDKGGNTARAIETWLRFVEERQGSTDWPMAAFYLAQAYQATGQYDEAIQIFRRLLLNHPNSPAAFNAMVPMAKCYLAKDPPEPELAEGILQSILVDHALTPKAPSYRQAMFVLGDLYYRNKKYDRAINILTEAIDRYPGDPQLGKSMFLVADSYRRSGQVLDDILAKLADDPTAMLSREKTEEQRRRHLESAKEYFDMAMTFFSNVDENRRSAMEEVYLRHCYLYRGDCLFDLGRYREAIQLYEMAVMRYQLTPTALGAFVQIVNCHLKLGNLAEARFTNERAIWQLRKIPDSALASAPGGMSRDQWGRWFQWLGQSGMW